MPHIATCAASTGQAAAALPGAPDYDILPSMLQSFNHDLVVASADREGLGYHLRKYLDASLIKVSHPDWKVHIYNSVTHRM